MADKISRARDANNWVMDFAWKPAMVLIATIVLASLGLSIAANNIGFDKVIDAYAQSIVAGIENKSTPCKIDNPRLIHLATEVAALRKILIDQNVSNILIHEQLLKNSHKATK